MPIGRIRMSGAVALLSLLLARGLAAQGSGATGDRFALEGATIAEYHAALEAGRVSVREAVEGYLVRIAEYDREGPSLNALVSVSSRALAVADSLDAVLRSSGLRGPLFGVPVVVKDNMHTVEMPTTAGSRALAESRPEGDAEVVRRLREAGAVILAKGNMAEFALSPFETVGSSTHGYTFNPYALNRSTAGSSGGTAVAVAADLGMVGVGTDTGNSVRGPASHSALVGLRPTFGLVSRWGIVPLYLDRDTPGPLTRTVEDAARLLEVVAGPDPRDPWTESAPGDLGRYVPHLKRDGLRGKRLGVLTQLTAHVDGDDEVMERFGEALVALRAAGATVVQPVLIPEIETLEHSTLWCYRFRYDLDDYLAGPGSGAGVASLTEILDRGLFHPALLETLTFFESQPDPEESPACREAEVTAERLREATRAVMRRYELDALVFPSWQNPPRLIGDLDSPDGNNNPVLAPPTGFPAITVPMGWVRRGQLPVGIQFVADAWREDLLFEIAFGYEQVTRHRRPPASTPPIG